MAGGAHGYEEASEERTDVAGGCDEGFEDPSGSEVDESGEIGCGVGSDAGKEQEEVATRLTIAALGIVMTPPT